MTKPISSGLLPASEKLLSDPATEGARHTITVLLTTVQFYRRGRCIEKGRGRDGKFRGKECQREKKRRE